MYFQLEHEVGGYATLQTRVWSETATWPADAKLLFIWTWTNDHVHGVTGIGKVPDVVIAAETGLDGARLKRAKRFLSRVAKVLWCENGWYLVIGRMRHTIFNNPKHANPKLLTCAETYLTEHRMPQALTAVLLEAYPDLTDTLSKGYTYPTDVPNPNPNPNPKPNPGTEAEYPPSPQGGAVAEIFRHHCQVMSTDPEKARQWMLTSALVEKIEQRLAMWTKEQLMVAATNLSKSEFHRGQNDKGREYCDPDFLYRSDGQISKWANVQADRGSGKGQYLTVGDEYNNVARKVDDDEPETK